MTLEQTPILRCDMPGCVSTFVLPNSALPAHVAFAAAAAAHGWAITASRVDLCPTHGGFDPDTGRRRQPPGVAVTASHLVDRFKAMGVGVAPGEEPPPPPAPVPTSAPRPPVKPKAPPEGRQGRGVGATNSSG